MQAAEGARPEVQPARGGGGGIDPSGPPNLGELIPAFPDPPAPILGPLSQLIQGVMPELAPPPQPQHGPPPAPGAPTGMEQETQGIAGAARGGSGGVLDTILNAAMSLFQGIIGNITGSARGSAGEAGTHAGTAAGGAASHAGTEGQGAAGEAHAATSSGTTEAKGHLDQFHQETHRDVGQAVGQAKQAPQHAAGQMPGIIQQILAGAPVFPSILGPFGPIFQTLLSGNLAQKIRSGIEKAERLVNAVLDRIEKAVSAVTKKIEAALTAVTQTIERAMAAVANLLAGMARTANGFISSLPSWARPPLGVVISGVLAAVARAADRIRERARRFLDAALEKARGFLRTVTDTVMRLAEAARTQITRAFAAVRRLAEAAISAIGRLTAWFIDKVKALISRALKAILQPIYQRVYDNLMKIIGPAVQGAITQARLMFPNGMPAPPQVAAAAVQAAQQAGPSILQQIQQGLLNPEGDHFSVGVQFGGDVVAGIGLAGGGGGTLEVVLDYRRNDVGFFIGPSGGAQLNFGPSIGATGNVSGIGSWGTVGSFGDPNQDVLQSWSGWFSNVSYGATAGLAAEGGLAVSTGGSFYRGGSVELNPPLVIFSYTPLGAGSHTVPGAQQPDRNVPGTPESTRTIDLGEVRFARGQDEPGAQPGGSAAIDHAAESVHTAPTDGGGINGVHVVGESSRRFLHPHGGATPEAENNALATSRANKVAAALRGRLGPTPPVEGHGAGARRAEADGKPADDGSPEYQRAVMFADVTVPGTPGHTEPGGTGPSHQEPNKHDVTVSAPNPFTSQRTAWGWDTTVGVSGLAGAKEEVAGYVGAGISYSFPIGKTHLAHDTMEAIRINFGIAKIMMDIMSLSPLGLLRDAVALFRVQAAPDAQTQMTHAATDWSLPAPPGVGVG